MIRGEFMGIWSCRVRIPEVQNHVYTVYTIFPLMFNPQNMNPKWDVVTATWDGATRLAPSTQQHWPLSGILLRELRERRDLVDAREIGDHVSGSPLDWKGTGTGMGQDSLSLRDLETWNGFIMVS